MRPKIFVVLSVFVGFLIGGFVVTRYFDIDISRFFAAENDRTVQTNFVYVQGKQLMLNGQPWWSKGSNWLGSRTVTQYCPFSEGTEAWCNMKYLDADQWKPQELEKELQWLHEVTGINTMRLNAVGLDLDGYWKPGYEARLLEFTRMAYRQGIRITWTLFFGVPGFECPQPDGTYTPCNVRGIPDIGGARLMPPGSEAETKTLRWARNFATTMRNEPGVLAYEVGNEMLLNGTIRAVGYQEQLLSYVTRILDVVRSIDPNHLTVSGETAVIERPSDNRWPWLESKGVNFVKFTDIHNLRGGQPFSLEDVTDINGIHFYQGPENAKTAMDVLVAASQKPLILGEFGGGGNATAYQWPEPNNQLLQHKAILDEARTRIAGAWVWNPTPFMDFQPGTYSIATWTDNAGRLRPLITVFGPPQRKIRALSFSHYTFIPQNNPLNTLFMQPAAREFSNRKTQFIVQSVPTTMTAGQQYPVSITLKNTGDSPWDRTFVAGGDQAYTWRIKPQNPPDNTTWGVASAPMSSAPILPNQNATFNFTVTAPSTPGTYNFQWQLNQGLVGWFGDKTPNVAVQVTAATPTPTVSITPTPTVSPTPTISPTPTPGSLPTFLIDGALISTRRQLEPFIFSGSGYTPNGNVERWVRAAGSNNNVRLSPNYAVSAQGTVSWSYTAGCSTSPSTSILWLIDVSTGKKSAEVAEIVNQHPNCIQNTQTPTPTPTGGVTPGQYGLREGDLVSAANSADPDIYIINQNGFKRLFLNPVIFSFYGHLGGFQNVKTVSASTRDAFKTSLYFKNCETNDPKVYAVQVTGEDTGVLHWLNITQEQATQQDPFFNQKIFCINNNEYAWYPKGSEYTSLGQVPAYQR
ncbi:MAG: cellulase family glycosylhydrolase [Patescibacteria group bacterium]